MSISFFELFKIGIGPSSSHTVGPMKAAFAFVEQLRQQQYLSKTAHLTVDLYGSLALTGDGHGTVKAIILGLIGERPELVDTATVPSILQQIAETKQLYLGKEHAIHFDQKQNIVLHANETLPKHSNGMQFTAHDNAEKKIFSQIYYSVGGGFIVAEDEFGKMPTDKKMPPYPFTTAKELLSLCQQYQLTIPELMLENEKTWQEETQVKLNIKKIAEAMADCVQRGCTSTEEYLPGGLEVHRRAPHLYQHLLEKENDPNLNSPDVMGWLDVYAMAVNEENAAGNRVVTAPTNGASGIVPAVLEYYKNFRNGNEQGIETFLLTAGAIAILYKLKASISGAEVGCQGEVGVACSMAAGALCAALGGSLAQIENAAEIGMEHNLGLTCDPINGLVQIPCIERNAMGAIKAVNATYIALRESGEHKVSLDKVIQTMKRTGDDMQTIYKETSLGGLAVNIPEC